MAAVERGLNQRRPASALLFVLTCALATPAAANDDAPAASADPATEEKDYAFFVGMAIAVERNRVRHPVVDADRAGIVVKEHGAPVRVPLREAEVILELEPKVSRAAVRIDKLDGKPVYTPAADPERRALEQTAMMMDLEQHSRDTATRELTQAQDNLGSLRAAQASGVQISAADLDRAEIRMNEANTGFSRAMSGSEFSGFTPGSSGDGNHDAFELSFELASEEPIVDAFALAVLVVRRPENARVRFQSIKFEPLPPIGPTPRRITIMRAGLQPGFSVDSYDVHIYANGRELATNRSARRTLVSREEACAYLVFTHVERNRALGTNDTVQIIPELLPPALGGLIPADRGIVPVDVEVGIDGHVETLSLGAGYSEPQLETALRAVRFYPAVRGGKATRDRGTFLLSDFIL
jgi:hypothetical protein